MNYQQTIEYLYNQLPMFSRVGVAAYKKDLDNTLELCRYLDDPHLKFKSIHIAGTNGKGSCSHMLAAILQEAGYKTGLYTSPHIRDFRERIRINGTKIPEVAVVEFAEKTMEIAGKIKPSFFELTVAMAFEHFANEQVDVAIIETGLGGRLDSTNVITPLLSVITNIGFDHMNLLGNTLPEIAIEKAGIIKNKIPVVLGETTAETLPVFLEKAIAQQAPVFQTGDHYQVESFESSGTFLRCTVHNKKTGSGECYTLDLPGNYQAKNLCTVLTAVDVLKKNAFHIGHETLLKALQRVRSTTHFKGRWETIQTNPTVILDVAHNEDGIRQVITQLRQICATAKMHFILGFVNDKDISRILSLFPKEAKYYFTNAHIPRAMPYQALKELASSFALTGNGYDDVNDALDAAKKQAGRNEVIMVCGSFFIIAEVKYQHHSSTAG